MSKRRVLILCTGNSCRSQMAEGLWRVLGGASWEVHSAGTRPAGFVHPLAVRAMAETDVDIRDQRSKSLDEYAGESFDVVVTVCDSAAQDCPMFPGGTRVLHWPLRDPAAVVRDEQEQMLAFRRTRDEIRARIARWLAHEPV